MCGRYAVAPTSADAWASAGEILGGDIEAALAALKPRYNVAPSTQVPMIYRDRQTREVRTVLARWGFVPHWWKEAKPPKFSTINARSEEAASKPLWRDAWKTHRCLVPATHWYEWQEAAGVKTPFAHQGVDGKGFMFAGLWSRWPRDTDPEQFTCAIVTRDAAPSIAHIHPRMPVILHPRAWLRWLEPGTAEPGWVSDILRENAVLEARTWEISRAVNRPGNDGPDLIAPLLE